MKVIQIRKKEVKRLADDMILYTETLKTPPKKKKKLLYLIKEFTKVTRYKINMQKSVVFIYKKNHLSERKILNPTYNCIKQNQIPRNKFNWGGEKPVL